MDLGTLPIRHSTSIPLIVRLPKRYEIYTESSSRDRKSVQSEFSDISVPHCERRPSLQLDSISDDEQVRTQDILKAMHWLKHELIFIRQDYILLKRQFLGIKKSLAQMTAREHTESCSSDKTSSAVSEESTDFDDDDSTVQMFMLRSASSYTTVTDSNDSDDSGDLRYRSCSSVPSLDITPATQDGVKDYLV